MAIHIGDALSLPRDEAMTRYLPMIRAIAAGLYTSLPVSIVFEDLVQAGAQGLLEALEHYDPERGAHFKTYAQPRILGAILDYLRQIDHVPRSLRSKARTIERATAGLEQALGRRPDIAELAGYIGIGVDLLEQWLLACGRLIVVSLDTFCPFHGKHTFLQCFPHPQEDLEAQHQAQQHQAQQHGQLHAALDALPSTWSRVLTLYYLEEHTMQDIAALLGVTESRISQIHAKALLRLRSTLQFSADWSNAV